jgi:hypothetical protein
MTGSAGFGIDIFAPAFTARIPNGGRNLVRTFWYVFGSVGSCPQNVSKDIFTIYKY